MWVYFSQPAENFDCDISNNLSFFRDFGDVAKKKRKLKSVVTFTLFHVHVLITSSTELYINALLSRVSVNVSLSVLCSLCRTPAPRILAIYW